MSRKAMESLKRKAMRSASLLVPDAKLNALVNLVRELVRERGYVKDETIRKFLAAGTKKSRSWSPARRRTKNDQQLP
jgi:hypothetical protein